MNIQDWFSLGSTALISLQSKGFSRVFSNTTVWKKELSVRSNRQGSQKRFSRKVPGRPENNSYLGRRTWRNSHPFFGLQCLLGQPVFTTISGLLAFKTQNCEGEWGLEQGKCHRACCSYWGLVIFLKWSPDCYKPLVNFQSFKKLNDFLLVLLLFLWKREVLVGFI